MHPLFSKADKLSYEVIGAAIEVHRLKGPGLIESIYERCMLHELSLRNVPAVTQRIVRVEYKGIVFEEPLRFDMLAQLLSYMKLLNIPLGLLINFHEMKLADGLTRMMLPGANQ